MSYVPAEPSGSIQMQGGSYVDESQYIEEQSYDASAYEPSQSSVPSTAVSIQQSTTATGVTTTHVETHETLRGLLRPAGAELIGSALFVFVACGAGMTTVKYQSAVRKQQQTHDALEKETHRPPTQLRRKQTIDLWGCSSQIYLHACAASCHVMSCHMLLELF